MVFFSLICHFLVLDPRLKAMGSIYGSPPIGLLYFIGPWTLDPHLKWRLEPGGFFQSEGGIQNCTNIKADDHGYHKITWFWYIIIVIKK
jgi:hypothetical protein